MQSNRHSLIQYMKILLATTFFFLTLILVTPIPVSAETSAGTTPSSFFYFFDTTFEKMNLFFTFDSEKRAEKALEYADERLAEIREIAKDNKPEEVEEAMTDYESKISTARDSAKNLDTEKAAALLNTISEKTELHQKTLSDILVEVPEAAREFILKAIERSKQGQEEVKKQNDELTNEVDRLRAEISELKAGNENSDETPNEESANRTTGDGRGVEPVIGQKSITPTPVTISAPILSKINEKPSETENIPLPEVLKVSPDALGLELLAFLNSQIAEQIKSDLDYYSRTITDLKDLLTLQQNNASKGKINCQTSYESKIAYAKSDAESQKTAYSESRSGFATQPSIITSIDSQLKRDLADIENWKISCLAQYEVNSSVVSRLSKVSSNLSSLKQHFNISKNDVSTSDINAIKNEIMSIARVLSNSVGISGNVSLPTVKSIASSVTCSDSPTGFSCRDNFGSNTMRCSQTTPGFLNCTDSSFNSVSCQTGVTPGSMRCSW